MIELIQKDRKLEALACFSRRRYAFCGYAIAASLPYRPLADQHKRSMEILSLFHQLTDNGYSNCTVFLWRKGFDYTVQVYQLCQEQVERYTSLDWVVNEEKK